MGSSLCKSFQPSTPASPTSKVVDISTVRKGDKYVTQIAPPHCLFCPRMEVLEIGFFASHGLALLAACLIVSPGCGRRGDWRFCVSLTGQNCIHCLSAACIASHGRNAVGLLGSSPRRSYSLHAQIPSPNVKYILSIILPKSLAGAKELLGVCGGRTPRQKQRGSATFSSCSHYC